VFPSFRFLRPPSCTLSVFLNNTYIINLTGCAYLILLCSKYYKTKICHEDKPKSAIEKENENNERKKEKFVKSDVGSNVLEETEEKIVF